MWRRYVLGNPRFLYRVWAQRRRNGSVARALGVTPAEEASVLEAFSHGVTGQAFRARTIALWHRLRGLLRMGSDGLKDGTFFA